MEKFRYAYDEAGNLLSETDAAGNTARYAYDEADRLVRMEAADGAVTTFGYDHEGKSCIGNRCAGSCDRIYL